MLKVENIGKSFGKNEVLKDISFSLNKGEVLAIIGSSGSGKTTLLRCLNFLETPQKGKISVGDEVLFDSDGEVAKSDLDIRRKRLHFGLVFQNFNLFPQYKVIENITLAPTLMAKEQLRENGSYKGAKNMKQAQQAIREEAESLLKRVGLYEKRNSYPCDLSGGQQQRVAIARTLVLNPDMILFDEPMSALDAEIKLSLRQQLKEIQKKLKITMIYVTHDQEEAFALSDRIMVINDLRIVQLDTPYNLYHHPADPFVKRFVVDHLDRKVQSIEQSIRENRA
jgi:polar amino acid transport system ATP-binding protein